jgi:hypothetical protein
MSFGVRFNTEITNYKLYTCNCEGEACNSILPFYIVVALPDDGRNCRPKHVVVNVKNR